MVCVFFFISLKKILCNMKILYFFVVVIQLNRNAAKVNLSVSPKKYSIYIFRKFPSILSLYLFQLHLHRNMHTSHVLWKLNLNAHIIHILYILMHSYIDIEIKVWIVKRWRCWMGNLDFVGWGSCCEWSSKHRYKKNAYLGRVKALRLKIELDFGKV
jgi:hypothetical protein